MLFYEDIHCNWGHLTLYYCHLFYVFYISYIVGFCTVILWLFRCILYIYCVCILFLFSSFIFSSLHIIYVNTEPYCQHFYICICMFVRWQSIIYLSIYLVDFRPFLSFLFFLKKEKLFDAQVRVGMKPSTWFSLPSSGVSQTWDLPDTQQGLGSAQRPRGLRDNGSGSWNEFKVTKVATLAHSA